MKTHLGLRIALLATVVCLSTCSVAKADPIGGVAASASSELFTVNFNRRAQFLVDGSGLSGSSHGIVPDGFMWLSTGNACCGGSPDANPTLTFDLGSTYSVDTMKVWNYNEGIPNLTARGINTANIFVAGADAVFSPLISNQAFNQAPGVSSDFSQLVALGGVEARYIQLSGMTHFPGVDNDFFGLSEVQFDGTLVGPPPPPPHAGLPNLRARASSQYLPDGRLADHAVNGNGLSIGNGHVANPPGGTMWLSDVDDAAPTFEIDLGGEYDLDLLRVWNYNENANPVCCLDRGVQTADIYVAGADGVYGAQPVVQNATFSKAPGANIDFSEITSLAGARGRYLMLKVTSNYGDPTFTGLSEAKVTGSRVRGKAPLPVSIESVSSNLAGFDRKADYLTNRIGVGFGDTHALNPETTMWLSQGTFPTSPTPDVAPEIAFDLGSVLQIGGMKVWNYNETVPGREDELLGRGVRLANVLVAGEDMVFQPLIEFLELDRAPGLADVDFSQTVDLGGASARFVKLQILANYNGKDFLDPLSDDGFQNFAGLSEVQFFEYTQLTFIPGDINQDGVVDRADAAQFARFYGTTSGAVWTTGDFDGDGATTLHDLTFLQANFGAVRPSPVAASAAVPEPSSLVLVLVGSIAIGASLRRAMIRRRLDKVPTASWIDQPVR